MIFGKYHERGKYHEFKNIYYEVGKYEIQIYEIGKYHDFPC